MIKITQEFEFERDASNSLKTTNYWSSLYDLDDWLRTEIKHNNNLSEDTYDAYEEVREKLRNIMDRHGVSLLDYD